MTFECHPPQQLSEMTFEVMDSSLVLGLLLEPPLLLVSERDSLVLNFPAEL